jgi:hypothetical protein
MWRKKDEGRNAQRAKDIEKERLRKKCCEGEKY